VWKNQGEDIRKKGDWSHWINPEPLGLKIEDIGLDWADLKKKYENSSAKDSATPVMPIETVLGVLWWRADRVGVGHGQDA
jgi:hypothetical protein